MGLPAALLRANIHSMRSEALAVMVKLPHSGKVKTRLVPPLSAPQAVGLYQAFLRDLFRRITDLDEIDIHVFFTPSEGVENPLETLDISSYDFSVTPQKGRCLGEKIKNVFSEMFFLGYKRVSVIGSDSPDMPLGLIRSAFSTLSAHPKSLVLGPATDGGYYLVAADTLYDEPFSDKIQWGTGCVLQQSIERAEEAGIEVRLIGEWYDVDTADDLKRLVKSSEAGASVKYIRKEGILF